MHLRNKLLALFCLLVFLGFGFLFFTEWVVRKPFAIILFVSDGLTPQHLAAARIYAGGADSRLQLERFPFSALLTNYAEDLAVPDTASVMETLATGLKTQVGNPADSDAETLFALAKRQGRAIGLVTTGNVTSPGPAAFYDGITRSSELEAVAAALAGDDDVLPDVLLGGGEAEFLPISKGGRRTDGRDLLLALRDRGVEHIRTRGDLEGLGAFRQGPLLGLFQSGPLSFTDRRPADSPEPSLPDMVRRAIEFLQFNRSGYLLIVDADLVTRAAMQNDGERVLRETLVLDDAIETARRYAGENGLIVAVGKHGVGGMALNASPLTREAGVAILGTNTFGIPAITWATGPNGPRDGAGQRAGPAAFHAPTAVPHATDVLAIGIGDGAEKLGGFMDNTDIFPLLKRKL